MHMEVPNAEHGGLSHRAHESGFVPSYEPRRRDNRDWGWRRDLEVLECIPEERDRTKGEGEQTRLRWPNSIGTSANDSDHMPTQLCLQSVYSDDDLRRSSPYAASERQPRKRHGQIVYPLNPQRS